MTPEEERMMRAQVEAILAKGMTPGMTPASGPSAARQAAQARASVSTGGMESKLKAQQAYASQLRGKDMPKGRTVGPYDVYMAPNWGESLAGAMNPVIGGLMARGMDDDYAALDSAKADQANAAAEIKQMDLADARQFTTDERLGGQDFRAGLQDDSQLFTGAQNDLQRGLQQSIAAANVALGERGQNLTAASSATSQEGLGKRSEAVSQRERPDGTTFDIVTVPGEGVFMYDKDQPGGRGQPAVLEGSIPLDTKATGSTVSLDTQAAKLAANEAEARWESEQGTALAIDDMNRRVDTATNILSNQDLENFTGYTNMRRLFAPYGIGEDAWKGQSIDQQLKYASTAGIAELAAIFKPMSDTDLKYLLSQFPDASSEPEAITAWMGIQGRDALEKTYRDKRATAKTQGEIDNLDAGWKAANTRLDIKIAEAAFRQGIDAADAKQIGMDIEELEYLYTTLAR